jgi:hypothetical protein
MHYTQEALEELRMHELVEIYNGLGAEPITEFRTKAQGVRRILALQTPALSQDEFVQSLPDTATVAARPWTPSRPSVAQRTRELLLRGEADEAVWHILCQEYRMSTGPGYVAWYRRGLEQGFERLDPVLEPSRFTSLPLNQGR